MEPSLHVFFIQLVFLFWFLMSNWLIFAVTTSIQKQSTTSWASLSLPVAVSTLFLLPTLKPPEIQGRILALPSGTCSQPGWPNGFNPVASSAGGNRASEGCVTGCCVVFIRLSTVVWDSALLTFMDWTMSCFLVKNLISWQPWYWKNACV